MKPRTVQMGELSEALAAVGHWLAQRCQSWRERVEIVAIDPSAPFRKALQTYLVRATASRGEATA